MNPALASPLTLGASAPEREILSLSGFAFPRGAISEITGPHSSGRTALAYSLLAQAAVRDEICAYIDTDHSFDPVSAAQSGVRLHQLLWLRCNHDVQKAFHCADLLLHAGGFGVVVLDLAHVSRRIAERIPLSYWHRFRRAIEHTPTILALIESESHAKSCSSLRLDLRRDQTVWTGAPGFEVLREIETEAVPRKPVPSQSIRVRAAVEVA